MKIPQNKPPQYYLFSIEELDMMALALKYFIEANRPLLSGEILYEFQELHGDIKLCAAGKL